ncbi:MAG: SDR family oxidoreductase [Phycisphaerales bacterium]|nr:SDR family oxidoreductase [Phycisphaerales bacterium]
MSENRSLEGRIAVITGASAGIGHAIAHHLASLGAAVVLNARRESKLQTLSDEINSQYGQFEGKPRAIVAAGDAADESVVESMLQSAAEHFRAEPDLIVVNAGRGLNGSVMTSDIGEWEEMVRTNLIGAALLIRKGGLRLVALQESREWPTKAADLVVLGSTVGRHISPFSSMYGSTKFAVNSLAEAARREIGPKGVRVTLIEPGIVRSEFQEVAGYDEAKFSELMDKYSPVLEPEDIARGIGFVCSQPAGVHFCGLMIRGTRQDYP